MSSQPTEPPLSLAEALPIEQARVRALIVTYRQLPNNVGLIAAMLMENTLQRADTAVMSGDLIGMIRAYEDLKGCAE